MMLYWLNVQNSFPDLSHKGLISRSGPNHYPCPNYDPDP
jgi:hypothetical protein